MLMPEQISVEAATPEFEFSESMRMVQESARNFAEKEIRPDVMKYDESQEFPHELIRKLGDLGFMGIIIPEAYGGSGFSYLEYVTILIEISRVDPSIGLSLAAHNSLCSNHLYSFGSEAQKKKYFPRLAAGAISAFALTEDSVGSDPAAMETNAILDDDTWVLNGEKLWCTNGTKAELLVVMARTP